MDHIICAQSVKARFVADQVSDGLRDECDGRHGTPIGGIGTSVVRPLLRPDFRTPAPVQRAFGRRYELQGSGAAKINGSFGGLILRSGP